MFLLAGSACAAGFLAYGIHWAFFDMERLPAGEHLTEATSPDGTYTLKAYASHGNATVSNAVRGELVFHEEKDKTKNIYWNYREESADIRWMDDDTVEINGRTLDVPHDTYDFRKE
ncbi:hypothetical protein SAMN05192534_1095 [Alteribacillus persepolensis]|uniref:DUF5412 domain-containing protein n=1 Tax=Alteribacillus persepolensis TaxID=568899 RepID=A0A1G8EAC1_9BACI|nr:DUF5412 domain-containing protein [Alteribacillus persepolensis]SDH66836.1 hypothetical protein SAMN05192534_1095 [Alteribacillus persepolensis]